MAISKEALQGLLKTDGTDYPMYSKKIDKTYSDIMSKLYLPANKFFNKFLKEKYKENPESEFFATMVGKKVKEHQGENIK